MRLGGLGLTPAQEEEIVAELAGHLEELYEEKRAQGLGESEAGEAVWRALDEVADWRRLARKIRRAKRKEENMNNRTKRFWLPALISVTGAVVFLTILTLVSLEPHMLWLRSKLPLMIYPVWVAAQPLFGAMAAYFSRRGGGERLARLGASLFPSMVVLALTCGLRLAHTVVHAPGDLGSLDLVSFMRTILFFVVVPGAATLLGALPFLKALKLRQS
jgi:hypothetical protein